MKKIVRKNQHRSFPPTFKRFKGIAQWDIELTDSCKYNLNSHDQLDWNKLIGVKKKFFHPKKDSVMIGWRYNIESDCFEFCFYYHVNNKVIINKIPYDSKDGKIQVTINLYTKILSINLDNIEYAELANKYINYTKGWLIKHWFGGTSKAPQKIIINYEKKN